MNELVTIISPCFNGEKYIDSFIMSVLQQTYDQIELIMIDDGSVDHTNEKIRSYEKAFAQRGFSLECRYQENKGQAAAINLGLQNYSGKYLMFADADDILVPDNVLEKVHYLEQHPEMGFVQCRGALKEKKFFSSECAVFERTNDGAADHFFEDLIHENNIVFQPQAYLIRTEAFKAAIPDQHLYESREGQNWQILLPLAYHYPCGYIDKILFQVVSHADSHSRVHRTYEQMRQRQDNIEILKTETVKKIPGMPEEERAGWFREIKIQHALNQLKLAYLRWDFRDMKAERQRLNSLGYTRKFKEMLLIYWGTLIWGRIWRIMKESVQKNRT